ncbi:AAA family ATPase [archaeon]|nr:AAA family ATPase [archaeon]
MAMSMGAENLESGTQRGKLETGFPSHYTILLSGPPGVGKYEYCLYLLRKWLDEGEKVVYVTTERPPEQILERAKACGFDLEGNENLEFVDFYSAATKDTKIRMYQYLTKVKDITNGIEDAIDKLGKPLRIIFDSLSPLFLYMSTDLMTRLIEDLTRDTKQKYGFILYTMQEGVHNPQLFHTIVYFLDGHLQMKFEETETIERKIRVHHMKGEASDPSWRNFVIGEHGFEFE